MRRALPLLLVLAASPRARSEEPVPTVSARSRIYLRLDPSSVPDPDGRIEPAALGNFRLSAHGEWDAEASGWVAHAPGSASYAEDALSGDVTTLLLARTMGPLRLTLGRQWTRVGGQRLQAVDGITGTLALDRRVEVSARAGLGGLEPREPLGDTPELGAEARFSPFTRGWFGVGVIHQRPEDAHERTRWTLSGDWRGARERWQLMAVATADVDQRAVVDARLEAALRPGETVWLRAYGRHTRVDLLLEPDELLAVFAEDLRDEIGALAEWLTVRWLRLRADAAVVYSEDRVGGSRWRLGADLYPRAGATVIVEATARLDRVGRSGSARAAARWPLWRSIFATLETLGDVDVDGDPAALARAGAGFEPWEGWFAYGALEGARTPRWAGRLSGVVILEHAIGAPVRWGGGP